MKKKIRWCPVAVDLVDFFQHLGPDGSLAFGLGLKGSEEQRAVFQAKYVGNQIGTQHGEELFVVTRAKITIRGAAQKNGWAALHGWVNNNHKKPCYLHLCLRTGKGRIDARF